MLVTALRLGQVVVLAAALPLALIAARGYRDAPFGSVLRPLVPIVVIYLGLGAGQVLYHGGLETLEVGLGAVALLLITWAIYNLATLLTGRRPV